MNQSRRVQLLALCVLAFSLLGSGVLTTMIASSQGAHELNYTDRAEDGDPPEIALGIAIGALRGLIVNYLWIRATDAKEEGRYYEAVELSRWITKLQPRLPRVWTFHAWNMAYNISVTTNTPSERWSWVNAGVNILRNEGLRINPNDMHMHKELGWIFLHKIGGYTDDSNQYYKRQFAYEWHSVMGAPPVIMKGVVPCMRWTLALSTARSNCGSWSRTRPWLSITAVMPLLVPRTSQRPVSSARMRVIWKCCQGPIELPNQASLLTVSSRSALWLRSATSSGYSTS